MNVDDRFDQFCRVNRLGELATNANTHPSTLATCEAFKIFFARQIRILEDLIRKQRGRSIAIHLAFCANPTLNAFAVAYDRDRYFVGINTGALQHLGNAYERLFVKADVTARLPLSGKRSDADQQRCVVAIAFFAASHFLLSHELGHIAYGHADAVYRLQPEQVSPLVEANDDYAQEAPAAIHQTMEVDADLYASTSLLFSMAQGHLCGVETSVFLTPPECFTVALVALLVMFHMFYGDVVNLSNYQTQTHPLPEIRMLKFSARAWQLRADVRALTVTERAGEQMLDIIDALPEKLKRAVFPGLRLEGRAKMQAEFARVRANEDRFERQLAASSLIPVGAVVV